MSKQTIPQEEPSSSAPPPPPPPPPLPPPLPPLHMLMFSALIFAVMRHLRYSSLSMFSCVCGSNA